MAEISEPAGRGFKAITVLTILFFLGVVAICIRTYDTGSEVAAAGPVVTTPASNAAAQAVTEASPVGAVATGGGGMAGDGPSVALPVFVALAAATMLAAGGMAVRRRTA